MAKNENSIKIKKILSEEGYEFIRQNGSHKIYKNKSTGNEITIKENLNKMVMQRLIKEINNRKEINKI